jgi:tRNA modification GTPase
MNIYALSSGPGASGIAVIRISGDNVREIITLLTNSDPPSPRVATVKKFNKISNSELIDEGLLLWFPGPESYTGEDMAEIQVHGSVAVIRSLLDQLSKVGNCRLAEPGEFTKLAFQNGKINLLKAESISDLISAETEIQRQQAIKVMSGRSSEKFNSIREKLLKILSNVEAKIDFPEEDLPVDVIKNIKSDSEKIRKEVEKILDDQKVGERIREGFKIAILGPTNAGKSSLLNYLSKREVAIVSEIAGTTRDVIEAHLNLDGYPVVISDTAGIRDSQDEIEKKGIKLALKRADDADLNIIVIEPKSIDFTGFLNVLVSEKSIIVINKIDLGYKNINQQIEKFNPIFLSIKNETNLEELINRIKDRLKNKFVSSNEILITRERHRQSLDACVQNLKNFEDKNSQEDFDKAAEDLRLATRHLGMIVGKVDVEEILGSIFSDFCIGK